MSGDFDSREIPIEHLSLIPNDSDILRPDGDAAFDGHNTLQAFRVNQIEWGQHQKVSALRDKLNDFGKSCGVKYGTYEGEHHLKDIMELITKDLSEPYSIYTYRYFIYQWPKLCHLAFDEKGNIIGSIVCKMEIAKASSVRHQSVRRGYIAMLAVSENHRRKKIGTSLVVSAVESLMLHGCDEVVLEAEVTNQKALKLYENLGFARHKRLFRYYLNGVDAFRLKLWLTYPAIVKERREALAVSEQAVS